MHGQAGAFQLQREHRGAGLAVRRGLRPGTLSQLRGLQLAHPRGELRPLRRRVTVRGEETGSQIALLVQRLRPVEATRQVVRTVEQVALMTRRHVVRIEPGREGPDVLGIGVGAAVQQQVGLQEIQSAPGPDAVREQRTWHLIGPPHPPHRIRSVRLPGADQIPCAIRLEHSRVIGPAVGRRAARGDGDGAATPVDGKA